MQKVFIIRDLLNCCLFLSTSICKRKSSYVISGILFRSCGTYQLETWRPIQNGETLSMIQNLFSCLNNHAVVTTEEIMQKINKKIYMQHKVEETENV